MDDAGREYIREALKPEGESGEARAYIQNIRKPEGEAGARMLEGMNVGVHARLSEWAFSFRRPGSDARALDVGCGGGANLARLLSCCPEGSVTGADYSATSVALSRDLVADAVADGRCRVLQADASELPLQDESIDFVTAFETVYFWPDVPKAFAEMARVLVPGGTFMIVNEVDGTHEGDFRLVGVVDGFQVLVPEEVRELLAEAGLAVEEEHHHPEESWVVYIARKGVA